MGGLRKLIIGILIGGGLILPGVSGAVLAVIFGIYDNMIYALSHFFKDIKKNTLFLTPLISGGLIGIFLFGRILNFLFTNHPSEAKFIFIGLIIGALPVLFNKLKEGSENHFNHKCFWAAFSIAMFLFVLDRTIININFSDQLNHGLIGKIMLFSAGFLYISGKIIPGISGSFLLMIIGMYEYVLNIIASFFDLTLPEIVALFPFFLGLFVGGVILIKWIERLLKMHFHGTYSAILGFVIGSIPVLYPGLRFDIRGIVGIGLLVLAFVISYNFSTSKEEIS